MAVRYCDTLRVLRHTGEIYDPFATSGDISTTETYNGPCKGYYKETLTNEGIANYVISIPEKKLNIDGRDELRFKSNGEGDEISMTVLNVKEYERNTLVYARQSKDGKIDDGTSEVHQ